MPTPAPYAESPDAVDEEYKEFPSCAKLMRTLDAADTCEESVSTRAFDRLAKGEYAGPWHGAKSQSQSAMLDLMRHWGEMRPYSEIREMVRTYQAHLFGQHVEPIIDPVFTNPRAQAKMRELRINQQLDDTGFDAIDDSVVLDAMFTRGRYYIGTQGTPAALAVIERGIEPGAGFVTRVGEGEFVIDPNAATWTDAAYISHGYVVARGLLLDSGLGDRKVIENLPLVADDHQGVRGWGQPIGGRTINPDEFLEDYVALREVCFRYRGKRFCCTIAADLKGGGEYVVEPYPIDNEPEGSRYELIELNTVPGSNVPFSPSMAIMEMHLAKSRSMAVMVRQMWNYRRAAIYAPGSADAVGKLQDPMNMDAAIEGDPSGVTDVELGGMAESLLKGWGLLEAVGQKIGPNVQQLSGSKSGSSTATGESLLAGNTQVVISYWRGKVDAARTNVIRRLSSLLDQNEAEVLELPMKLSNGITVPMVWDYRSLDPSYDKFLYKIKPYRAETMDPRMRARSIIEAIQVVGPFLQTVSMLGGNLQNALSVLADATGTPELLNIFPTQDVEMLKMRVTQMLAMKGGTPQAGGGMVSPGGGAMTRVDQARSDFSAGVPA